jgi:hypothetical protein
MKLVVYKNKNSDPVELEAEKLFLYDVTGQPIFAANIVCIPKHSNNIIYISVKKLPSEVKNEIGNL